MTTSDDLAMTSNDARATVVRFYQDALTVNTRTTPTQALGELLADDFQSINSHETKTRTMLAQQLEGIWKLVPDLRWEPQDVIVAGAQVIVRSVATGTPRGPFMGVPCDGSRSFRMDTIDIHELVGGRVARVHHVEDWAAALRQLAGR